MNFKDIDVSISYKSVGDDSFKKTLNELLPITKSYKRSVGFFSSSALDFIGDGILGLAKNGGHISLATCPQLSEEDVIAISAGYEARNVLSSAFSQEVRTAFQQLTDENAKLLYLLIKEKVLDIKQC